MTPQNTTLPQAKQAVYAEPASLLDSIVETQATILDTILEAQITIASQPVSTPVLDAIVEDMAKPVAPKPSNPVWVIDLKVHWVLCSVCRLKNCECGMSHMTVSKASVTRIK